MSVFPAILFQEILPTRVKAHLARFRHDACFEWCHWYFRRNRQRILPLM